MGLLDGKRIVITGVLTDASLAYGVAELALAEGAEIVLTGAGRGIRLTQRTARKLGDGIDVVEFDVTEPAHAAALRDDLAERWGRVDGALHAIGFAPEICLGGTFMDASWDDVKVVLEISTYSLKMLADAVAPLMDGGGSIVGLDFDATRAWPAYDWMGVAKAGLESTCRYLAPLPGPSGHPGEPGVGRAREDHGRPVDPRIRRVRGRLVAEGPRSAGTSPTRARCRARSWRCSATGCRPPPDPWCKPTAATTPSAPRWLVLNGNLPQSASR